MAEGVQGERACRDLLAARGFKIGRTSYYDDQRAILAEPVRAEFDLELDGD